MIKIHFIKSEFFLDLPEINTIVFELTDTVAQELDVERDSKVLRKLKIENLESSYNYRTIGDYYHLYTSGLSKNLICIPVRYNSNLFLNAVELSSETKNVVFRMYKASKHLIISYS